MNSSSSNHPITTFPSKLSTLPRSYTTSPSLSRNGYSGFADWRSHSGYHNSANYSVPSPEGESLPSTSTESPAMITILTDKLDSQAKTIQSLTRQVEVLQRERDRTETHLRRLDQDLSKVDQRLQEGGVNLETERKVEGWKREVTLQLGDLHSQVTSHRRNASEEGYADDVLNSLTREVHEFKRQTQEDTAVCRREIDSLNTRLMRYEIDRGNQQADGKDLIRRMDQLDRTLTNLSDSQRSQSKELNHTIQGRQSRDQELLQLRSEMTRLMNVVDRLETDVPYTSTNSHRLITHEQPALPQINASHRAPPPPITSQGKLVKSKHDSVSAKTRADDARHSGNNRHRPLFAELTSDSDDDNDLYTGSLSPASSDSEDFSLDLPPHETKRVQRSMYASYSRDEDNSDAISEMTSALVGHDPNLDLVDLGSTPSISSIESDVDLL